MNRTKTYGSISNTDSDESDYLETILNENEQEIEKIESNNCSYIVEPVAFIYNLASSIISISLSQFIYNKILDRLIEQEISNKNGTNLTTIHPQYSIIMQSNLSNICNNNNSSNLTIIPLLFNKYNSSLPPDVLNRIQIEAQEQSANLYFEMALYSSIPVILMTNLLGVNCSNLGRKCLMLLFLFTLSLRYLLFLLQCLYPKWPDWIFHLGAVLEGMSGGSGIFYLALFSCITDLTSPKTRSFRISLLVNISSAASLCVLYICGYVIKYYGYFYLFLASLCLALLALIYTLFFVPETLTDLKHKNLLQRLRDCSIRKCFNCFKVYFNNDNTDKSSNYNNKDTVSLPTPADNEQDEEETFLLLSKRNKKLSTKKQTWVLLSIVLANFLFSFGVCGIGSIFNLFIMNKPFCFDSIEISKYQIFSGIVSLIFSLIVSKFLKINDLLICCMAVFTYFGSVFFYIYGSSIIYIYAGALVSSISMLQFTYARSVVSKSVAKEEVSDALCLIILVDTFISVLSVILFPMIYSKIVSKGVTNLFWFSNSIIFVAFILNVYVYF